jgi:hypothetical protein
VATAAAEVSIGAAVSVSSSASVFSGLEERDASKLVEVTSRSLVEGEEAMVLGRRDVPSCSVVLGRMLRRGWSSVPWGLGAKTMSFMCP